MILAKNAPLYAPRRLYKLDIIVLGRHNTDL